MQYGHFDQTKREYVIDRVDVLETVSGVAIYEITPDVLAYVGGVGKVNAAMSAQLFIDRYHPDWNPQAGEQGGHGLHVAGGELHPVHCGDEADGVAGGGGVHVVLDKASAAG